MITDTQKWINKIHRENWSRLTDFERNQLRKEYKWRRRYIGKSKVESRTSISDIVKWHLWFNSEKPEY